jgi:thioredoxin reductase (NADPH)
VIIATGASAKLLGLESERRLMGYGVSACATCDGFFFKDKSVIVVGGGDTAMEEAIFLTKFARQVTVVHRRDSLRASKIMADRAMRNEKIQFIWNSAVSEIHGSPEGDGVNAVTLTEVASGTTRMLPIEGVFIAIGHEPNTQLHGGHRRRTLAGSSARCVTVVRRASPAAVTDNSVVEPPGSSRTSPGCRPDPPLLLRSGTWLSPSSSRPHSS